MAFGVDDYIMLQLALTGAGMIGGALGEKNRSDQASEYNREQSRIADEMNAQRAKEAAKSAKVNRAIAATSFLGPSPIKERDDSFQKLYPEKQDESFNWERLIGGAGQGYAMGQNVGGDIANYYLIKKLMEQKQGPSVANTPVTFPNSAAATPTSTGGRSGSRFGNRAVK